MKSTLDEAWAALAKSKEDMARYYNQHWTPAPNFTVSEKVFLDALDISTTRPTKKFTHCYLGLFPIVRPVGLHVYQLKPPQSMSHIHPVFHVIKLMPAPPDPIKGRRTRRPPPPEIVGGEERYEVEEIINSQMRGRKLQYLVQVEGLWTRRKFVAFGKRSRSPRFDHGLPRSPPHCTKTHKRVSIQKDGFSTSTTNTAVVRSCTLGHCALRGG
jgi:hypothetical protein